MALEVTDSNFKEIVEQNKITVIDFWAPWCGPCKMLGPVIDELVVENTDISIGKIDVSVHTEMAKEFNVRGIPALVFFKDGKEVKRVVGFKQKAELQKNIDSLK